MSAELPPPIDERLSRARGRRRTAAVVALVATVAAIPATVLVFLGGEANAVVLFVPWLLVAWLLASQLRRREGLLEARKARVVGWIGTALAAALGLLAWEEDAWPLMLAAGAVLVCHLALVVAAWVEVATNPADVAPAARPWVWGLVVAVSLLILVLVLPTPHPPISRNESLAIGDLRAIAAAEGDYAAANQGFHDQPRCLVTPSACIPGYAASDLPFLTADSLPLGTRRGYRWSFHPGPRAVPSPGLEGRVSPTSLQGFAWTAVPERFEKTGVRAFCVDGTGAVLYSADGTLPEVRDGRCPPGLRPLL